MMMGKLIENKSDMLFPSMHEFVYSNHNMDQYKI